MHVYVMPLYFTLSALISAISLRYLMFCFAQSWNFLTNPYYFSLWSSLPLFSSFPINYSWLFLNIQRLYTLLSTVTWTQNQTLLEWLKKLTVDGKVLLSTLISLSFTLIIFCLNSRKEFSKWHQEPPLAEVFLLFCLLNHCMYTIYSLIVRWCCPAGFFEWLLFLVLVKIRLIESFLSDSSGLLVQILF